MSNVNVADAQVESWDIDKIKPYEKNHKKHPPKQIQALADSIKDQGLNDPITVDAKGVIISGHGRLEAVRSLGWQKVPVRCLRDLSKAKADKLRIAANKTSGTDYDIDILQEELERLSFLGEKVTDLGFDDKELDMLLEDIGVMDDDIAITDIGDAVGQFDEEVETAANEAEEKEIPIARIFGISKVPLQTQKVGNAFMAEIQKSTGLEGIEALVAHMKQVVGDD